MDREVEDIFNESESDGETPSKPAKSKLGHTLDTADESSSSSADSLSGKIIHCNFLRPKEQSGAVILRD